MTIFHRKKKALIISENTVNLEWSVKELEPLKLQVKTASNVVEALRLIRGPERDRSKHQWLPDVIISDWKMPLSGYDGLELLFIVRNDPLLQRCRFVLRGAWRNPLYDGLAFFKSLPIQADVNAPLNLNNGELLAAIGKLLQEAGE